jgi:hypothetical protein
MSKKSFFKTTLTATALLAASGYTVMAQAHCVGLNTVPAELLFGASQVGDATFNSGQAFPQYQFDTYVTVCPAGATGLSGKINKRSGAAGSVGMEIAKGGYGHTNAADAAATAGASCAGGNTTAGSVIVPTLNGGEGQYTITVSKDTTTAIQYAMEFHCLGGAGDLPESQSILDADPLNDAGTEVTGEIDRVQNH